MQGQRARRTSALFLAGSLLAGAAGLAGCGASSSPTAGSGQGKGLVVRVVAAENFWGSIAAQLGGTHAQVTSIITNPTTDPHSYEPTTRDAETLASAQLVIENGIGYDPWVGHLLAADNAGSTVLNVGTLLGVPDGGNPHRWYNPADVRIVIARIVADLRVLDPHDRAYFAARAVWFNDVALRPYRAKVAAIRMRFAGTKVGASESIFAMLAPALGLDLITPPSFLRAISEGTDVSAADKEAIDTQIADHQIRIYVYNSQNVTPDVQSQLSDGQGGAHPVRHDHRDTRARELDVRGMADQPARGHRGRARERGNGAADDDPRCAGGRRRDPPRARLGPPGRPRHLVRRDAARRPTASSSRSSARTASGSRRSSRLRSDSSRCTKAASRCSVDHPGTRDARSATSRSDGASTQGFASAGSTSCGSGPTASAGAWTCRDSRGSHRVVAPPTSGWSRCSSSSAPRRSPIGRSGRSRAASSSASSSPRHSSARPKLLVLDEPLDSLDLPNQAAIAALVSTVSPRPGRHGPARGP